MNSCRLRQLQFHQPPSLAVLGAIIAAAAVCNVEAIAAAPPMPFLRRLGCCRLPCRLTDTAVFYITHAVLLEPTKIRSVVIHVDLSFLPSYHCSNSSSSYSSPPTVLPSCSLPDFGPTLSSSRHLRGSAVLNRMCYAQRHRPSCFTVRAGLP